MITVFVGNIGSGKTTLAARFAEKARRKGLTVYTNVPEINGVKVSLNDFKSNLIKDGLLIWDEAALDLNSRDFKDKSKRPFYDWLRLSRHHHVNCIFFSQAADMDITIRRLASRIWVLKRGLFFTRQDLFVPRIKADELTGEIVQKWQQYPAVPFLFRRWTLRPLWYRFTDSWASPLDGLPELPAVQPWRRENIKSHSKGVSEDTPDAATLT